MWADAFEHIVGRVEFKTLRKSDLRQFHPLQTIGLLAYLTEEMGVLVIIMVMVVTVAEFLFRSVAAALDGMDQMVLAEKRLMSCSSSSLTQFVSSIFSVLSAKILYFLKKMKELQKKSLYLQSEYELKTVLS